MGFQCCDDVVAFGFVVTFLYCQLLIMVAYLHAQIAATRMYHEIMSPDFIHVHLDKVVAAAEGTKRAHSVVHIEKSLPRR